jgi:hypothetical protein
MKLPGWMAALFLDIDVKSQIVLLVEQVIFGLTIFLPSHSPSFKKPPASSKKIISITCRNE